MINRKQSPRIKDAVEFDLKLPPLESFSLSNEIPVYFTRSNEQETLQIEWVFDAGNWYESSSLIASAANSLMKNGTAKRSSREINETIEFYGAFFSANCTHEFASLTLHCLEKHVTKLLPVVYEILTEAIFPENELDIYRKNGKQKLSIDLEKCDFVANQLIEKYLFGEYHPYGRYTTMEAYDTLQRDNIYAFYKKHYTFNHCKVFIAGKIPENIEQVMNDIFGQEEWNGRQDFTPADYPLQPALEKKYRISNDPDGVQGAVRLARPFPNRYHPDVPAMKVLNTIFGGYFGSRLMNNIREDKGYTYGIFSALYLYHKAGELCIMTEAGKDVCEDTVSETYKEMQRLCNEPVSQEELSLVRNYMVGSILGDLDGSFKVIRRWKGLILSGLDENYFNTSINTIKTISSKDLQELAQKYYIKDDFYELVVV